MAIHTSHPDMGYRRISDELNRRYDVHVNEKRILRIDRVLHIQSTIKHRCNSCTRSSTAPEYTTKNYLNRDFKAETPNQKWLTDVTEFKYYEDMEVHKIYLSAILDLYDRRIVSFVVGDHNDNALVFKTFDMAVIENPGACPLFHSDRGYQYTSRVFHMKLVNAGMKQSMSKIAHCIDNGPMEGFWGILKREKYYGKRFTNKQELSNMIKTYIHYYNYERLQRNLSVMTPFEYHKQYLVA